MSNHVRFTKEEKEEDYELVLQGLRNGQNCTEIARELGRSVQYIVNIKNDLISRKIITQEEIDSYYTDNSTINTLKKTVLQRFKAGKNMQEIADELNTSSSTIARIRDILIEEKLISSNEINELNEEVIKRKVIKQKVLQGFKEKKSPKELSVELRVSLTTIARIKKALIEEGLISEEEILNEQSEDVRDRDERVLGKLKAGVKQAQIAREEAISPALVTMLKQKFIIEGKLEGQTGKTTKNKDKKRNKKVQSEVNYTVNTDYSKLGEQEKQVIGLLLKGYPLLYICKKLDIEQFDLNTIIQELKKKKYITSFQIKNAREKLKEDDEKSILVFLKRGYSQVDILQELPHLTRATISRRISDLVKKGEMTQEQIKIYQYEAPQGEKEIMEFVLKKLQLGFTVKEIIEADENGFLTERRVRNAIEMLIQAGRITKFEIEKAKANRNAQKRADEELSVKMQILELLRQGKSSQDIADEMKVSYNFVWMRVSKMKNTGEFPDSQQALATKAQKRSKYGKEYAIILRMLNSGCKIKVIAQAIGKSRHFVSERIEELKEYRMISDEDINRARKESEIRKTELKKDYADAKKVLEDERKFEARPATRFVRIM